MRKLSHILLAIFPIALVALVGAPLASPADGITEKCDAANALHVPFNQLAGEALGLRSLGGAFILILLIGVMFLFATRFLGKMTSGILIIVGAALLISADRAGLFDSFFQSSCKAAPFIPHTMALLGLS